MILAFNTVSHKWNYKMSNFDEKIVSWPIASDKSAKIVTDAATSTTMDICYWKYGYILSFNTDMAIFTTV